MLDQTQLPSLLEAIILAASRPMTEEDILKLFPELERPNKKDLKRALKELQDSSEQRGVRLVELASGYQFQIKVEWAPYISKLWEEKAPRYSRALFETLALIAYRQPITRGEIEEIRGVSLSPSIFKTLQEEREWIRVVGHKEVPGRPALYATTKNFLDYFGLNSLEGLPSLPEIMNLDAVQLPEGEIFGHKIEETATAETEIEESEIEETEIKEATAENAETSNETIDEESEAHFLVNDEKIEENPKLTEETC